MMAGCGRMILGSDSHTRYGALGTMGVGEGGPELVKQLLGLEDVPRPDHAADALAAAICYTTHQGFEGMVASA